MSRSLFFVLIRPLEILLEFLLYYLLFPIAYLVIVIFIQYRKDVIWNNLLSSFPEKSEIELKQIKKKFYIHLIDLLIEGILMLVLSERTLMKKFSFSNPEIINSFYDQGRSVILVGGHFNNWEYLVVTLNKQFKHQGTGIGQKISSRFVSYLMNQRRTRMDTEVWDASNVRNKFKAYIEENKLFCCLMLADQSVNKVERSYWLEFLNQDTPVYFGPENLARKYNLPILYYSCRKIKRGVYNCTLKLITDNAVSEAESDIIYIYNKMLEKDIRESPPYWLWSHKRWKHKDKAPSSDKVRRSSSSLSDQK